MDYKKLLDGAYQELPEKAKEKTRFKMPSFESFIQGKETIIKNFANVANDLRRDPNHLMKFLFKELATVGSFNGSRLILKGRFRDIELNKRLDYYTKTYVLCPACGKPDTQLVHQGGVLFIRCEACGARSPVPVMK
ncbi:MAG: translation initiation factor IF-2 subunit beta [Candidatus Diapherotrites archaeon]|nr:translation initiation factor IF-2 subunit beta [Candidatus Diapherotrites archaeon]